MIILLSAIAVLEFFYIIYQDIVNRRERDKLHLKIMSRDTTEYKKATEKPAKSSEPKEDPYVPLDDVPVEKLMRAEDKL